MPKLPWTPSLKSAGTGHLSVDRPTSPKVHTLHTPRCAGQGQQPASKGFTDTGCSAAVVRPHDSPCHLGALPPRICLKAMLRWLLHSQPIRVLLAPIPAAKPNAQPSSCPCPRRWRLAVGCTHRPPARLPRPRRRRPPAAAASARPASDCTLRSPAKQPQAPTRLKCGIRMHMPTSS